MHLIATLLMTLGSLQDADAKKIEDLVRQLGADEFSVREKATEELKKMGKPAEPALRQAAEKNEDPEVRERAKSILDSLAPKAVAPPRRPLPGVPGLRGFNGSSVSIQTVNGDSTYRMTPGYGSPGITFHKTQAGAVKLEYSDAKGESKSAEAESLEKFVKDHAELAATYGITEEGIEFGGTKVRFKGGFPVMPMPMPRGLRVPRALPDEEDERESFRAGGATFENPSDALRTQLEIPADRGLVVTKVEAGGAAEASGLRKSDVLLEIDGAKVSAAADLRERMKSAAPVVVLRKGKRESLTPSVPKKDF